MVQKQLRKKEVFASNLPIGELESTKFYIHKLHYRRTLDVVTALKAIAASLSASEEKSGAESDLITTLNTVQTLEESNSIVLTGTTATLEKAKTLIAEIDLPVRQVLIEVLVLDTTVNNALNFGVVWGAKLQRRNLAIEGGFFPSNSNIPFSLTSSNIINGLAGVTQVPAPPMTPPAPHASFPSSVFDLTPNNIIGPSILGPSLANGSGFTTGSIGRKILFNGHGFFSMAALVNAVRNDQQIDIIMTPKITTEHNVPAEIFVGAKIPVKAQSVAQNSGSILTTNYEYRDTGILLKVTPLISSHETITLIIEQRISTAIQSQVDGQGNLNAPPATINESRTLTRVHLPSDHFIVLGGLISETQITQKDQIPCLGALPIVGSLFSVNANSNLKHNLMIFLRPHIIDTTLDIDETTKKQQDIFKDKSRLISKQRTALDDTMNMLNLRPN